MDDPSSMIVLLLLVLLAGFFSGSEAALFSLSRLQLNRLARSSGWKGRILDHLLASPRSLLTCLLLGETLARVGMCGWAFHLLRRREVASGHGWGLWLTAFACSILLLVLAEVLPRAVAGKACLGWSVLFATPLRLACWLMAPLRIFGFEGARLISRLFQIQIEPGKHVSVDEIRDALENNPFEAVLDEDEKRLINSFFEFRDARVREVMVSRIAMIACHKDISLRNAKEVFRRSRHSRLPVYGQGKDDMVGVACARDLLERLYHEGGEGTLGEIIRPPLFVPASVSVLSALRTLQRERTQMGLVLDEFGGVAGLITVDDLLESLVGDILEEEEDETPVTPLARGRYRVDPRAPIRQVEEALDLRLPDLDVGTFGGLVYVLSESVPSEGEILSVGPLTVTVERLAGHRMASLVVERARKGEAIQGMEKAWELR